MSAKACVGFFFFCLDLQLFVKIKKDMVSTHSFFTLINNSRSKQNKRNPAHPFADIKVENVCKIPAKNIKLYGSSSSSKFLIF